MTGEPAARGEFGVRTPRRLTIVRGSGAELWDDRGRRFVDLGASLGVGNLGHSNPEIVAAIRAQAGELLHIGSAYATPARQRLVERLLSLLPLPLTRVFLSNSGTEAMEAALKIARSSTGRPKFVAAVRGFHGRTMGALSATWREELREPFEPLVPGFVHVPYNDPAALLRAVDGSTAAVVLEIVQGEGGVHVADGAYLRAAREACDASGSLLIFDEIQTGMARTGTLWAFERSGIVPDVLVLAKSLAGGVPIGATVTSEAIDGRFRGSHHSTFGGNPLACAAGVAALGFVVRERLAERTDRLGSVGIARLRSEASPMVREVRGQGLLIGIELSERAPPVLEALLEKGFLASSAGSHVVRLLPPLVISNADWDAALEAIREVTSGG